MLSESITDHLASRKLNLKKIFAALWLNTVLIGILGLCFAGSSKAATGTDWLNAFKFAVLFDLAAGAVLFCLFLTAMSIVVLTRRTPEPKRKGELQLA